MSSGRALVSHDQGAIWEDVYYLNNGNAAGYAATLSLDGEEMLTLTGAMPGDANPWAAAVGKTEFAIIRWRLKA